MLPTRILSVSLALVLFTAACSCSADPIVYVVNLAQQFGTVDLMTGVFHQIGPHTPQPQGGFRDRMDLCCLSPSLELLNPLTLPPG
jgi:hypothetical protein